VAHRLELDRSGLRAGMRVAVGVSGGADSVALLRAVAEIAPEIGLVLMVAHVEHGIRGVEAEEDAESVRKLAERLDLAFALHRVDTPAVARAQKLSLEEAARELRYRWFRSLLAEGKADAVATAHTLDDQAETVVHRLLRGAWTEGLGGIHPVIACTGGVILRPFLRVRHAEIEGWLRELGQPWREDATNADTAFTRNRIRHELLPQVAGFNPRIAEQLANLAAIARDEESWWDAELHRLLPSLVLPGKPMRGGGRAVSTRPDEGSLGMELERLRGLAPAMRRRVLRAAAEQLRCGLNFEQTERLMAMCGAELSAGSRKQQLTAELRAERTARELRLVREADPAMREGAESYELPIPGEVTGLGVTLRARVVGEADGISAAILRTARPGDRVKLKYSRSAKPLKEIFERMGVGAEARRDWPVLAWEGRLVWMRDVVAEAEDVPFAVEVISTS
jgi:tRNA(Ile)-lysidine synthase